MNAIDTSALVYDRTSGAYYNASDLNRVAEFCETVVSSAIAEIANIAAMRATYGVAPSPYSLPDYTVTAITVKKDFVRTDTYTAAQLTRYLQNANYVIGKFPPAARKNMPEVMRFLTYLSANNIEENLKLSAENLVARSNVTEKNIVNTAAAFCYAGEIYGGEI
ncbi:MAG: hypothetical protein IJU41_03650 [Clostridia bacterium]|nr:hypothetical protein [Clostridia bacterium]